MEFNFITIILTIFNIALLILLIAGFFIGVKSINENIKRNKERDKKIDIILDKVIDKLDEKEDK